MHWSAGTYAPSFYDKQFYHFLVDGEGAVHKGIYPPEANLNVQDGKYCAHTGGGNTGAIGVALCGMANFRSKDDVGKFPIKPKQLESFLELCARLCVKYSIPINAKTVMTHYEFGLANPKTTSAGKVDICYLPPYPTVEKRNVGAFLRQKIRWYAEKITK